MGPLLQNLKNFIEVEKDYINEETLEFLEPYLTAKAPDGQELFVPKVAKNASAALEGLCIMVGGLYDFSKISHLIEAQRYYVENPAMRLQNAGAQAVEEQFQALLLKKEAQKIADSINVQDLKDLMAQEKPYPKVLQVLKAVLILRGEKKNFAWKSCQKMTQNAKGFIASLKNFDLQDVPVNNLRQVEAIVMDAEFTQENQMAESLAVAQIGSWVRKVVEFNQLLGRLPHQNEYQKQQSVCTENAQQAIGSIVLKDIQNLKALANPPVAVAQTMSILCILFGEKDTSWQSCKALMSNPSALLAKLNGYDFDHVPKSMLKKIEAVTSQMEFTPQNIATKSAAAAGICDYINNVVEYCSLKNENKANIAQINDSIVNQQMPSKEQKLPCEPVMQMQEANVAAVDDQDQAMLILQEAQKKLNLVAVNDVKEMAKMKNEVPMGMPVFKACLLLQGEKKNFGWARCQAMMQDAQAFLNYLKAFDITNITESTLMQLLPIVYGPGFNFKRMKNFSMAAAGICGWLIKVVEYCFLTMNLQSVQDKYEQASVYTDKAAAALNCLEVKAFQELKAFKAPPQDCITACQALCHFVRGNDQKQYSWQDCQKLMNNPKALIDQIVALDINAVPQKVFKTLAKFTAMEQFNWKDMVKKSAACGCIAEYIINVEQYNLVMQESKASNQEINDSLVNLQMPVSEKTVGQKFYAIDEDFKCAVPYLIASQESLKKLPSSDKLMRAENEAFETIKPKFNALVQCFNMLPADKGEMSSLFQQRSNQWQELSHTHSELLSNFQQCMQKVAQQAGETHQYQEATTIRRAVANVHENAKSQKASCSPRKINNSARSKVAGNIKSQQTAKVTQAKADYNRASMNAIVNSAKSGRFTMEPAANRKQNSMLTSQSTSQLYSPSKGERTLVYTQSEMGQELSQKIFAKEQELLQLRANFSGTDWRNRSASTQLQTVQQVSRSPVKAHTTSYEVQHQANREINTRTMNASLVESVQEDLDEFKVFEEQAAEAMPKVPQPIAQPTSPSKSYKNLQSPTKQNQVSKYDQDDYKTLVLGQSILSAKRFSEVRKLSPKKLRGSAKVQYMVNPADISALKSLQYPPQLVKELCYCVYEVVNGDISGVENKWNACLQMMNNPVNLCQILEEIFVINEEGRFDQNRLYNARECVKQNSLEDLLCKSSACGSLYNWMQLITGAHYIGQQAQNNQQRTTGFSAYQHTKASNNKVKTDEQAPSPVRSIKKSRKSVQPAVKICPVNKKNIAELKSLKSPPAAVYSVLKGVVQIIDAIPANEIDFAYCIKTISKSNFMGELNDVYENVVNNGAKIADEHLTYTNKLLSKTSVAAIQAHSHAAGNLCQWLVDVSQFQDTAVIQKGTIQADLEDPNDYFMNHIDDKPKSKKKKKSKKTQIEEDKEQLMLAYSGVTKPQKISKSPTKQTTIKSKQMASTIMPLGRRSNSLTKFERDENLGKSKMWSLNNQDSAPQIDIAGANATYYKASSKSPSSMQKEIQAIEQNYRQHPNGKVNNKFSNVDLDAKTAAIQQEFERLRTSQSGVSLGEAGRYQSDNFYTIMDDFYHGDNTKRHVSPTKRLINQKNSAWEGKGKISSDMRRTSEYALHYTTEPGKSYVIEPKDGVIDYNLARKNPTAFYDKAGTHEVTEHKWYSPKK